MKYMTECFNGPLPHEMTDDELNDFFIKNILNADLKVYGTRVKSFTTPVVDNRLQGYFHLTTKTEKKFNVKMRFKEERAYYINHVPTMINNFEKCTNCDNEKCKKIKIWTAPFKNTKRTKLLYSGEGYDYLLILERSKDELYIVSSYLLNEPGYLEKVLKEYEKYKKVP